MCKNYIVFLYFSDVLLSFNIADLLLLHITYVLTVWKFSQTEKGTYTCVHKYMYIIMDITFVFLLFQKIARLCVCFTYVTLIIVIITGKLAFMLSLARVVGV